MTEPHALVALVDEIIAMYHTTRLSSAMVAEHILSKPSVKKALLALTPTGTGERWQPIETARTDGTRIDLWVNFADEYQHRVTDAYFGRPHHTCGEAGRYCDSCPPDRDVWCDEFGAIDGTPTHWMPLPEGPKP